MYSSICNLGKENPSAKNLMGHPLGIYGVIKRLGKILLEISPEINRKLEQFNENDKKLTTF